MKSACGVAYLGVLEAINDYLMARGVPNRELPKKVEEYEKALKKYASVHPTVGAYANGKLAKEFDFLYDELHIAGYYRGMLHKVDTVKSVMKGAKELINKLK